MARLCHCVFQKLVPSSQDANSNLVSLHRILMKVTATAYNGTHILQIGAFVSQVKWRPRLALTDFPIKDTLDGTSQTSQDLPYLVCQVVQPSRLWGWTAASTYKRHIQRFMQPSSKGNRRLQDCVHGPRQDCKANAFQCCPTATNLWLHGSLYRVPVQVWRNQMLSRTIPHHT